MIARPPSGPRGRVRASETFKAVLDTYMAGQRNELKPRSYVLKERHFLKHCAHSTPWR